MMVVQCVNILLLQSVWGSYWEAGQWGYACCHSMVKGSYCTGEAGKLARKVFQPIRL